MVFGGRTDGSLWEAVLSANKNVVLLGLTVQLTVTVLGPQHGKLYVKMACGVPPKRKVTVIDKRTVIMEVWRKYYPILGLFILYINHGRSV